MQTLSLGSARDLFRSAVHPRLLFGPDDVAVIRRHTRTGDGRRVLAALRNKVRPFVDRVLADDQWVDVVSTGAFFWPNADEAFVWALPDVAMLGLIDEDERAIAAGAQVLDAVAQTSPTHRNGGLVCNNYYIPPLFLPYGFDLLAPHLDGDVRQRYVAWAIEGHVRQGMARRQNIYLRNAAHNMTLGGMAIALATLLVTAGEKHAPDLSAEQAQLLLWFEASLGTAIGPDGYPEEDIGYGTVVAPVLVQLAEMLHRAGIFDAYDRCPHVAQFGRAMLHFVQPWGEFLANTGDHGDQLRDREFVLARLAQRQRDPALLWLLGAITYKHSRTFISCNVDHLEAEVRLRPSVSMPASWQSLLVVDAMKTARTPAQARTPTSFIDRRRGIVSLRSGWDKDATFVVFDGSQRLPAAPGHYHSSCGHVSISALGEQFAIDTGRYNVDQDCHNVVLVDGKSGRSTNSEWVAAAHAGQLTSYTPHAFVDTASVNSSHQHNCYWAHRHIAFVKPGRRKVPAYVWLIDDINKNDDWAEYWWQLHTSPENTITLSDQTATIRGHRHGHLLDAHWVLFDPTAYAKPHTLTLDQDVAGPSATKYVGDLDAAVAKFPRPADMLHGPVFRRPRLLAKVAGYNGRFMSLLLPRKKNQKPALVERLPTLENALAVRITFANVIDTLIYAYDHQLLEAADVLARGQWCVVRRDRKTGRLLQSGTDGRFIRKG